MTNVEIQVGKFGRTNLGKIFIFAYIENAQGERYKNKVILSDGKKIINEFYYFEKDEKIVKESFNLIDLIEAGDYVNGTQVDEFDDEDGNLYLGFGIYTDSCMDCIEEVRPLSTVEIKTIVTKEQFEAMEYKVGDKND